MIPFQTWLTQIVEYSRFIADTLGVRRAWIEGDHSKTSVTDFDELYEQIFDDLDSDTFEEELDAHLPNDEVARQVLKAFLGELRSIDFVRSCDKKLKSPSALLGSDEWSQVVVKARRVASTFTSTNDGGKQAMQ